MVSGKIVSSIGLVCDMFGATCLAIEFVRKPKIQKRIDVTLNEIRKYIPLLPDKGLFEMLDVLREINDTKVQELVKQIETLEKQKYGKLGFKLLILGFFLQLLAVWLG